MKKVLLILFMIIPLLGVGQNETVVDSATVTILDRMSDLIGDLGSCSFILETSVDAKNDHGEYEKQYTTHEVHFSGNNKMPRKMLDYLGGILLYLSLDALFLIRHLAKVELVY